MRALRTATAAAFVCGGQLSGLAQSLWAPAGMPGLAVGPQQQVYASPAHDTIYFAGIISFTGSQSWQQSNSVLRYTAGQWDTLGVINGVVMTVVQYRDTLLVGGHQFLSCSGEPCSQVAFWDGASWRPYGDFGAYSVRKLRVLDGELYAVGGFNEVEGQPATGVAKRVGNSWQPVGQLNLTSSIQDVAKYDGKLIVIGNLEFPTGRDIAQWDGNEWSLLGPGIISLISSPICLAVYQGDLYVAGNIPMVPPGNPGQNIMRWDGEQFHALGQGVQWWLGDTHSTATVLTMVEHDGKLFVGGGYRAAGGIEALGLSTWDGVEWCAVPGDFRASGGIWSMDFYSDTLFVACGTTLDGNTVNGTAKFIGSQYETDCSGPVGMVVHEESGVILYPNPASDLITLEFGECRFTRYQLFDARGNAVRQGALTAGTSLVLSLMSVAPGAYALRLTHPTQAPVTMKLIKQ